MVDFKTKKTRVILVLTPFYPLGLFLFMESLDNYLLGLHRFAQEYKYESLYKVLDFLTLGNHVYQGYDYDVFYPIISIVYLAPIYLYWIVMPIIRFIARWISRGQ